VLACLLLYSHTDDLLVTRLQSLLSQHQTTDDSTNNFDYDYTSSSELQDDRDEDNIGPLHLNLPILHNNNDIDNATTAVSITNNITSTVQYSDIEISNHNFRVSFNPAYDENVTTTLSYDLSIASSMSDDGSNVSTSTASTTSTTTSSDDFANQINESHATATTLPSLLLLLHTTPIDYNNQDNNNSDSNEEEQNRTTEMDFISGSDTSASNLHDDYLNTFLYNDSLLMLDESSADYNASDVESDVTTIDLLEMTLETTTISEMETHSQDDFVNSFNETSFDSNATTLSSGGGEDEEETFVISTIPHETTYQQEEQSKEMEDFEASNKFVYHHIAPATSLTPPPPTTTTSPPATTSTTPATTKVRFPTYDEEIQVDGSINRPHLIKFPDDSADTQLYITESKPAATTTATPWSRDSNHHRTTNLIKFWQQQPLIADTAYYGRPSTQQQHHHHQQQHHHRGNSKFGNLHRDSSRSIYRVLHQRNWKNHR